MDLAQLNTVIGADIAPLQQGLNQAKASLINFANLTNSLENLRPFSPFLVQAIEASKDINNLRDALAQLKIEQAAALNPRELQAYNAAIASITGEIKSLTATETQIRSTGNTLTQAFSQLRQIAYILPGIGIAGIFNLAFGAIQSAASELNIFNQESEQTKKIIEDQSSAFASAAGNVTKELSQLQALVQAGRDENLTRDQRNNAIKELQKLYPDLLKNLDLENINSQATTISINKLTDAIVRKSKADAIASLISKTQASIFEAQNKPLLEQVGILDKLKAVMEAGPFGAGGAGSLVSSALKNQSQSLTELNSLLNDYEKQLNGIVTEQTKAGDFQITNPDHIKNAKSLADVLGELKEKLSVITEEEGVFGVSLNTIQERINAIKGTITELLNIHVSATSGIIQQLIDQMKVFQTEIDNAKNKLDLFGLKSGGAPLTAPAAPQLPVTPLNGDAILKSLTDRKNNEALDRMKKQIADITTVAKELGHVFDRVFYDLLTTGKITFKSLGESIARFVAHLVSSIIETALLKTVIGALTGGVGIPAAAFTALSLTPHAEGGIFTQPTLIGSHLFGEKGPEALMPLNRLDSMLNGMNRNNNVEVTGSMEMSFNKLLIIFKRAQNYTAKNYGNFSNG